MTPVQDMIHRYHELSSAGRLAFYTAYLNDADNEQDSMQTLQMEVRFKDGEQCLHCGSTHIVKNGRRKDGVQRYLCRDCRKSFLASTNSIVSHTHKNLSVWKTYFECLMKARTLRDTSQECGISMGTAFQWRHKILDALQEVGQEVCLDGTVEAEETFFDLSRKGNHESRGRAAAPRNMGEKGIGEEIPGHSEAAATLETDGNSNGPETQEYSKAAASRKMRGNGNGPETQEYSEAAASHEKRKDSEEARAEKEKVCVLCAINEDGIPISRVARLGKASPECVEKAFTGRISSDAVLVTDDDRAFTIFSKDHGVRLVQVEPDRRTQGPESSNNNQGIQGIPGNQGIQGIPEIQGITGIQGIQEIQGITETQGIQEIQGLMGIRLISAYHRCIKAFVSRFKGVSTKYLDNYLTWYNLTQCSLEHRRDTERFLMGHALNTRKRVLGREISARPAVPVLA